MGENSKIAWTHHTFSPWVGCQRVSPGCTHCYAEAYDRRVGGAKLPDGTKSLRWGPTAPRVRTSAANWRQPLKWNADAVKANVAADLAGQPRPERPRVFCSSLADVFEVPRPGGSDLDSWLLELLDLVVRTPSLDWLLLTKRPATIKARLSAAVDAWARTPGCAAGAELAQEWVDGRPPANVWLGTTVEDQQRANERIPALLSVPARVRFLSCEPLLERVDLSRWLPSQPWAVRGGDGRPRAAPTLPRPGVDWVIIGGESGPGARPFALEWARDLVKQARAAGVAPFVKQLGARASDEVNGIAGASLKVHPDAAALISRRLVDPAGGDPAEWPSDLRVREFPEVPS